MAAFYVGKPAPSLLSGGVLVEDSKVTRARSSHEPFDRRAGGNFAQRRQDGDFLQTLAAELGRRQTQRAGKPATQVGSAVAALTTASVAAFSASSTRRPDRLERCMRADMSFINMTASVGANALVGILR
jgi:hypothetical protein